MFFKLFKSEMKRNKVINLTLFLFIMLAALLVSSALYLTITLIKGVDQLVTISDTPHFVQMHAGEVDMEDFEVFNEEFNYIKSFQIVKMLSVSGSEIYINSDEISEAKSVMDVSLVEQNKDFDYLLDMNNQVANIGEGEIGVPIYYMRDRELSIGDSVFLKRNGISREFTITSFIRDSQMNPAIVSSKRFLLNRKDFQELDSIYNDYEYLIEYKFNSLDNIDQFSRAYSETKMPSSGPSVDINLFKTLNGLTDGMIVVILVIVSLLLSIIGILCLRYTLLSTVEEDIREIGVLKAIGICHGKIQFIYLAKYMVLTMIACVSGYVFSFFVNKILVRNITEYMGGVSTGVVIYYMPFIGALIVFALTIVSIWIILRRLKKIRVIEALKSYQTAKDSGIIPILKLSQIKGFPINLFIGLNKVFMNLSSHLLILLIFVISGFIMVVPVNMLTTISSPLFINYMGVGQSDLRLDVRNFDESDKTLHSLLDFIEKDEDIASYGIFKTNSMIVLNSQGEKESITLEVGDVSRFPIDYIEGSFPREGMISLSVLAANSLEKTVGDKVYILNDGEVLEVYVSGIYQDITNGGKTAKSLSELSDGSILWYVINMNLKKGVDVQEKRSIYGNKFSNIKITDIDEYIKQTLSGTIEQIKLVAMINCLIALAIGALITGLFLKMMLTKESREIAVLRSIGFNRNNIMCQYMTRILTVLLIGILVGIVIALTLGQKLVGMISSSFGASTITFIVEPMLTYVLLPVIFAIVVMVTSWVSINQHKLSSINKRLVE